MLLLYKLLNTNYRNSTINNKNIDIINPAYDIFLEMAFSPELARALGMGVFTTKKIKFH